MNGLHCKSCGHKILTFTERVKEKSGAKITCEHCGVLLQQPAYGLLVCFVTAGMLNAITAPLTGGSSYTWISLVIAFAVINILFFPYRISFDKNTPVSELEGIAHPKPLKWYTSPVVFVLILLLLIALFINYAIT